MVEEPSQPNDVWVPHILHQTWKTSDVPQGFRKSIETWRKLQPSWKYKLWDDDANQRLVDAKYPWLQAAFQEMSGIQRADIMRYLYMHAFGGVYADLDVALVRPLRPLLQKHRRLNSTILLGQEPLAHAVLLERKPRQVCNAVIVSVPGQIFWLDLVRHATSHMGASSMYADPVQTTGPRMLERAVVRWHKRRRAVEQQFGLARRDDLVVLPPDLFYPTWDPMQTQTLRKRCNNLAQGRGSNVAAAAGTAAARDGLDTAAASVASVCARLRREGFVPALPQDGSAFTNHWWAHTWIPGAQKVNVDR